MSLEGKELLPFITIAKAQARRMIMEVRDKNGLTGPAHIMTFEANTQLVFGFDVTITGKPQKLFAIEYGKMGVLSDRVSPIHIIKTRVTSNQSSGQEMNVVCDAKVLKMLVEDQSKVPEITFSLQEVNDILVCRLSDTCVLWVSTKGSK